MKEIGTNTAEPIVIVAVLRNLVTNLAEARGGDIVAAVAYTRLRAAVGRTMTSELYNATFTHKEGLSWVVRDREGDGTQLEYFCLCSEE